MTFKTFLINEKIDDGKDGSVFEVTNIPDDLIELYKKHKIKKGSSVRLSEDEKNVNIIDYFTFGEGKLNDIYIYPVLCSTKAIKISAPSKFTTIKGGKTDNNYFSKSKSNYDTSAREFGELLAFKHYVETGSKITEQELLQLYCKEGVINNYKKRTLVTVNKHLDVFGELGLSGDYLFEMDKSGISILIRDRFKTFNKNENLGIATGGNGARWNPSDIWIVKKSEVNNIKKELEKMTMMGELNLFISKKLSSRELIGVSLKEPNNKSAPKISIRNALDGQNIELHSLKISHITIAPSFRSMTSSTNKSAIGFIYDLQGKYKTNNKVKVEFLPGAGGIGIRDNSRNTGEGNIAYYYRQQYNKIGKSIPEKTKISEDDFLLAKNVYKKYSKFITTDRWDIDWDNAMVRDESGKIVESRKSFALKYYMLARELGHIQDNWLYFQKWLQIYGQAIHKHKSSAFVLIS